MSRGGGRGEIDRGRGEMDRGRGRGEHMLTYFCIVVHLNAIVSNSYLGLAVELSNYWNSWVL